MLDCIALYNLYLQSTSSAINTSSDPREIIALIDIGEERTLIVVVQGGHLLFCRNISNPVRFCFDHDNSTYVQKSIIDEPDDSAGLSSEGSPPSDGGGKTLEESPESMPGVSQSSLDPLIEKIDFTLYSLSYEQVTASLSMVWLTGRIAAQAGICDYFTKNLGIETRFFHPFEAMEKLEKEHNHFHDQAAGWAVPLGLTMEMKRSKRNQFNLRQEELGYQKKYSQFKGMSAVLGLLLGLAISLSMVNIHYRIGIQREKLGRINEKIHHVFQELFPKGASTEDELLQTRKVLKAEKEKYKVYSVFFQGALTHLEIMKDLSLQVPREIQVELIDLSIDRNQIKIKGIADSFESVDRLKNSLQKLKRYAQTVVESAKVKGTDNKVDFRLNITASDG
jgi:Tfp pilus assembly protein PilN